MERYTREDAAFGVLSGLVIGNERQSHWSWYHLGNVDSKIVICVYAVALRVVDLVTRSLHEHFNIDVSLEHHWLSLRAHDGSSNVNGIGKKRTIWGVFQSAGAEPEDAAFAFALPIEGRVDWNNLISSKIDPARKSFHEADHVVYDFVRMRDSALKDTAYDWTTWVAPRFIVRKNATP